MSSAEQIPFTISTQGSATVAAPVGPQGVPPSNVNAAVVAEQDKTLTYKVGEKIEQLKETAQPVVDAAQPYVGAARETTINAAVAAKEAVVSGATTLGLVSDNSGPHGVPPSDADHQGVVAQQDKSLTTRIGEAAQPIIQPVVNAAQPIVQTAQGVVVATKEAVVSGAQAAGAAIGIGGTANAGSTPTGPHGVPPSELGPGVVAQEDKSLTTKIAEAAQPYVQPVVNAAQGAAQVVGQYAAAATATLSTGTSQIADQVAELRDEAQRQAGLGVSTAGGKPEAPHGVAPTNYNHGGVVAQQDKTVVQIAGEKLAEVKDQAAAVVGSAVGEVKHQAGLGINIQPGQKPEAPHGVAPTNYNHTGLVAQQDKTVAQIAAEKLADVKDQAAAVVGTTVGSAVGEVKYQAGLGANLQPGQKPEAPHGVAPTDYNHTGVVAQQDKTVAQVAAEKLADVKDQAAAVVGTYVGEAKHQAGLGVNVQPGLAPEAPHGVAPSEGLHTGLVAQQDKTVAQVAAEKLVDAKDQAAAALNNAAGSAQAAVDQAKFQAGLGAPVKAGVTPEAPHGVAPSAGLHAGVVAKEDKTVAQVAAEKVGL